MENSKSNLEVLRVNGRPRSKSDEQRDEPHE